MVSPRRRVGREVARELLFPKLEPVASANALSRALSLAREALSPLGESANGLLRADRANIWVSEEIHLDIDRETHEKALRSALEMGPGAQRDATLSLALLEDGVLLEGEPYDDWALRPREALESLRQRARLELARDRSHGLGRSQPDQVIEAWEACLYHDPTCEEAASALIRVYGAQRRHALAETVYRRCRSATEELGLRVSPALEEAHRAGTSPAGLDERASENSPPRAIDRLREDRRLVSVLFVELTLSPEVLGKPGPEDLRELIRGALAEVVAHVEDFGGTVTSVSGAGLVALFGAPESHEDDPERALLAAFRVVSRHRTRALSVRAGVETGPAVVGWIAGSRAAHYGAVGEVVAVAAALQAAARPASVLVGPTTRATISALFEWGPPEAVAAPPGAKPVVASYLERPKARRPSSQGGRRALAWGAPLVGRRAEVARLREAVREATEGKGGVLLLVGEPGLGKSRLVRECRSLFMAWVGAASGRLPLWLEGRAASYASSKPYGLYQQLLAAFAGVAPDEDEEIVRPALERAMKTVFGSRAANEQLGLLAYAMGLEGGGAGPDLAGLSPEAVQRATFAAFRSLLSRLVAHSPTVLVLEDLHWADPTSLNLTKELASVANEGPLLLVLTRRPEPDPGVSALEAGLSEVGGLTVRRVELSPLPRSAERDLSRSLLGEAASDHVVDFACRGTEGNPLFLEERVTSLLETRSLVKDEAGWQIALGTSEELPEALERLVSSRLDRLEADLRDAIVAASVLGTEFGLGALSSVADTDGSLADAVSALCSARLLVQVREVPEPVYRFRHALIQEATYNGLLRDDRQRLHARAAWGLEAAWGGRTEEFATVLGHHFQIAGEPERAVHYFEAAGDRATEAFANDEAISSLSSALTLAHDDAVPGDAFAKTEARLQAKLAEVLFRVGRRHEAVEAFQAAIVRVDPADELETARLLTRLGRVHLADKRYDAALSVLGTAEALLRDHLQDQDDRWADQWLEAVVDGQAGVYLELGQPELARTVLEEARPFVEPEGGLARKKTFYWLLAWLRASQNGWRVDEEDIANLRRAADAARGTGDVVDLGFSARDIGLYLCLHGDLEEARQYLETALATAVRVGDLNMRAQSLSYLVLTAVRSQDAPAVRSLASQTMAASQAAVYPEGVFLATASLAWLAWQEGRAEDVARLAREIMDLDGATIEPECRLKWIYLFPLIGMHLAAGEVAEAVAVGQQILGPSVQRLPIDLEAQLASAGDAWQRGEPDVASHCLAAALDLADALRYI